MPRISFTWSQSERALLIPLIWALWLLESCSTAPWMLANDPNTLSFMRRSSLFATHTLQWKEWSLHLVSGSEHVRSQKRITESTGDSATINESGLITGQFNSRLSWVAQRSKFLPTVVERCWTWLISCCPNAFNIFQQLQAISRGSRTLPRIEETASAGGKLWDMFQSTWINMNQLQCRIA